MDQREEKAYVSAPAIASDIREFDPDAMRVSDTPLLRRPLDYYPRVWGATLVRRGLVPSPTLDSVIINWGSNSLSAMKRSQLSDWSQIANLADFQ